LVCVELDLGKLPASPATAGTHCPEFGKSCGAAVIRDVCGVLRLILWGAGEHGQNTRNESMAT
jgi:hypothetical protein